MELVEITNDKKNWGTFKDSLKAPVHRWFTYPAGFSYKAVQHSIETYKITKGMTVYDPFMGSGTTNLLCKSKGIHSVGVEPHPLVYRITNAKMNWDIDFEEIRSFNMDLNLKFDSKVQKIRSSKNTLNSLFPDLILKCYSEKTLYDLCSIKEVFQESSLSKKSKDFIFTCITALLRDVSSAATGWPYIAPSKVKTSSMGKDALEEYNKLSESMLSDISEIKKSADDSYSETQHKLILGSSTDVSGIIIDNSIDHIFTSPPYLNNFDYSDRTRLELYFWGMAKTWGDITRNVRNKLMTSATTQVLRLDPKFKISDDLYHYCPEVAAFIKSSTDQLTELRKEKKGKKSYDFMVIGYFNDVFKILQESYRVLKSGSSALFVLGDSAPYGVHIPTDELIGKIGVSVGFSEYSIKVLRTRGGKWKTNPQRHSVPLRESIVIFKKG